MKVYATLAEYPRYRFHCDGAIFISDRKLDQWKLVKQTITVLKQNNKNYRRYLVNIEDKNGKRKVEKAHRLICRAFHGKPPKSKPEVRHRNGNSLDNRAVNLIWGSRIENQKDRVKHGSHNRGERCAAAKLNRRQVLAIRKSKLRNFELAKIFGMSQTAIHNIKTKKQWVWL